MIGRTINHILNRAGLNLQRVERSAPTAADRRILNQARAKFPEMQFELARHIQPASVYTVPHHRRRRIVWGNFATRHLTGGRILDIASSLDWVLGISAFADVTMVDIRDHPMCDTFPFRFVQADAADLPFEDASFDVVSAWQLLHHLGVTDGSIDPYKGATVIKEAARVLAPGGRLILATYAEEQPVMKIGTIRVYGVQELRDLLADAGLTIEAETLAEGWIMACAVKDHEPR